VLRLRRQRELEEALGFVRGGEVEEEIMTAVSCVFIRTGKAQRNYAGAPGSSHLKYTWHACNLLKVVPRSHTRLDCRVVVPASPVFTQKGYVIKNRFKCLSLCLLLTRTQRRQMTSFNRMHMIWIDIIWGRSTKEVMVRSHSLRSKEDSIMKTQP